MIVTDRFTVDTNILFYAVDPSDRRHTLAEGLMLGAPRLGAYLGSQTLGEFFHATTRKGVMPAADARRQVANWTEIFRVFTPGVADLEVAMRAAEAHELSYWDAHLLASALRAGCKIILSEDMHDGFIFGDLRVVNPFDPANGDTVAPILAARDMAR